MTYLLIYSSNNSTYRCILIVLTVCYQDIYFQEKLQPEATGLQPIIMQNDRDHGNLAKYCLGAQGRTRVKLSWLDINSTSAGYLVSVFTLKAW